jgi:hypothetical protein
MDRQTIYAGQIPLETDQLKQGQNTMVGLAKLSAAVLGTSTIVNGFTVTPTAPASLNVIVTPGEVYQLENLEQAAWSSLSPDTHTILKQGVLLDPATFGITPPNTVGYSQAFLVEVQYQDVDSGSTVLPYFNAADPQIPFAGPGNLGSAQNTVRKGVAALQVKAGIAAATGMQTAPTADAGWTAIFVVTVANGATTITSGNISQVPLAPFIPVTLPNVPSGVQSGQWLYGVDTGAVNAMVANVTPIPSQLVPGMTVHIRAANTNTGAVTLALNGLGASAIHRANGAALSAGDINAGMVVELIWDGASWQIANYFGFTSNTTNNNTYVLSIPYAADSSATPNSIIVAPNPAITSLAAPQELIVKLANTVTGATTITVNSMAAVPVVRPDGTPLQANDAFAGEMLWLIYNGSAFQLCVKASSDLIDTAVTYTVHGAGANFTDLNAAFEYLSKFKITHNGSVTLQLAAGTFSYTTNVFMDHPQNHRIAIKGATMLAAMPTTIGSYATSGFATRTTDNTTNIAMLRTKFATEIDLVGGVVWAVDNVMLADIDAILFVGDNTSTNGPGNGLLLGCGAQSNNPISGGTSGLAFYNFKSAALAMNNRAVWQVDASKPFAFIGNNNVALELTTGSQFYFTSALFVLGGASVGVYVIENSELFGAGTLYSLCNAIDGIGVINGRVSVSGGLTQKNGGWGLNAQQGSSCLNANVDFGSNNNSGGVIAQYGTIVRLAGSVNYTTSPTVNTVGNSNSYVSST